MKFSLDRYKSTQINYPRVFSMRTCVDKAKYANMETSWLDNGGQGAEESFKQIKERMPEKYYSQIYGAHRNYVSYAENAFPAFRFILEEVLMDDWLSIMDPHHSGKRDHSLHQPLTAYIVSELLGQGDKEKALVVNGRSLLSECARQLLNNKRTEYLCEYFNALYPKGMPPEPFRQIWLESVFYHAAVLAALFHDIGYPWQYINKLSGGIGFVEIAESYGIGFSSQVIYEMIKDRLLIFPFHGYSRLSVLKPISSWHSELLKNIEDAFLNTHGFPGALAFTYLNDKIRQFPKDYDFNAATTLFVQDWAAVGILMHDMCSQYHGQGSTPKNPHYKLFFDVDPLSCIISLVDVLEEFARPKAKFEHGESELKVMFRSPCIGTEIVIEGDVLKIIYIYEEQNQVVANLSSRKKEINDYFDSYTGYIDLTAIGIEKVVCECKKYKD